MHTMVIIQHHVVYLKVSNERSGAIVREAALQQGLGEHGLRLRSSDCWDVYQ